MAKFHNKVTITNPILLLLEVELKYIRLLEKIYLHRLVEKMQPSFSGSDEIVPNASLP
jgi:hypothetical protein